MIIRLRRGPTTVLGIPFSIQESEEQSKTTSMFLGVRSTDEQAPNYKEDPSKIIIPSSFRKKKPDEQATKSYNHSGFSTFHPVNRNKNVSSHYIVLDSACPLVSCQCQVASSTTIL